MPKLDPRLSVVAEQIRSLTQAHTHADIGSDHAHLLVALLQSGTIYRGIAIENKPAPMENSRQALAGYNASVRLADGLAGLKENEADSLSLCGMGGLRMVSILNSIPNRIPEQLVVQPNDHVPEVRRWGFRSGFRLVDEHLVCGSRDYVVLCFCRERSSASTGGSESSGEDPAYKGLVAETAIEFGPHLIRRWEPSFVQRLRDEQAYLLGLPGLNPQSKRRLDRISKLLGDGLDALQRSEL